MLFLVFGALGLLAAATGIYGLVSYDVAQRSRDIGVRIALGATSARVVQQVIGTGLRLVLTGIAFGILAALGIGRAMASLLVRDHAVRRYRAAHHDGRLLAGDPGELVALHGDWDLPRARAVFEKAISLNPNHAAAHQFLACAPSPRATMSEPSSRTHVPWSSIRSTCR